VLAYKTPARVPGFFYEVERAALDGGKGMAYTSTYIPPGFEIGRSATKAGGVL